MREQRDAIDHLRKDILERKSATEDELKRIDNDVKAIVTDAAEFAQNSPEPDPSELYTDVYAAA